MSADEATEPVALLPAYTQSLARNPAGLVFPEYLKRRIDSRTAEIAQLEAQLAGVQAKIQRLRRENVEDFRSKEIYEDVVFMKTTGVVEPKLKMTWQVVPDSLRPSRERQHGTNSTYTQGCRCDDCRRAHTEYARDLRRRQSSSKN